MKFDKKNLLMKIKIKILNAKFMQQIMLEIYVLVNLNLDQRNVKYRFLFKPWGVSRMGSLAEVAPG